MKTFKQAMGTLSRNMLFLHGHVISVRDLDGAAQRSAYPAASRKTESSREADQEATWSYTCKECTT